MAEHHHGRGGSYSFDPTSNQDRLRAYDMAANSDERSDIAGQKMDLAQQRAAFDQAYRLSESERKSQQFQQRFEQSQGQLGITQQRMQLQQDIAQNTELLKQQAALIKDKATVARQNAAKQFYGGVSDLDPQNPNFQQKFGQLMGNVQSQLVDSDGKLPEDVMKVSDHLWQQHNTWAATQVKTQANPTQAWQDALAGSQPQYGVADENGKNFNATEAGKAAQTHVQTTYKEPGGKIVTQVLPRTVFDGAVAASQSRNQVSPAVVPPVAAPAVPVVPVATDAPPVDTTVQAPPKPPLSDIFK